MAFGITIFNTSPGVGEGVRVGVREFVVPKTLPNVIGANVLIAVGVGASVGVSVGIGVLVGTGVTVGVGDGVGIGQLFGRFGVKA